MNILVTGAQGFIGKNLVHALKNTGFDNIFEYDVDTGAGSLNNWCMDCGFVFHLAGVNRPDNDKEYEDVNTGFTAQLLEFLKANNNNCPIMLASSTHALLDNPYGKSKKNAEELIAKHSRITGARALIYRFPNVFGKWCRPNYNSAVATFCNNTANGLPIKVNDPSTSIELLYIDDLTDEMQRALNGNENRDGDHCSAPISYKKQLGEIAAIIQGFSKCRAELSVPNLSDPLIRKLYSTYISYLPVDSLAYPLNIHSDHRGFFAEVLRTPDRGQLSVNLSKPRVTKGNHWHVSKHEKFLVVGGEGIIKLRRIDSGKMYELCVNGKTPEVVDIPPGYAHSIINTGETDMITLMWANEPYDPDRPDTYRTEVES